MWIRIVLATIALAAMLDCKAVHKGKAQKETFPNEADVNKHMVEFEPKGHKHYNDMRYESEENDEGRSKRSTKSFNRWLASKNGALVIPFLLDSTLTSTKKTAIRDALQGLNNILSCHSPFVERDVTKHGNLHYLKYFSGSGCWSYVGRSHDADGFQEISIGDGCQHIGTIQHETLHALGFGHEQSREDRDSYVTINFENITPGFEGNFAKMSGTSEISKQSPYDYESVMHYGSNYFSNNNLPTIVPKQSGATIGQREKLSQNDREELNKYFQCDGYVFVTDPPTTLAPVSKQLLRSTKFEAYTNNIYFSSWNQGGCIDKYSNCDELKDYCYQSSIGSGCLKTCGCSPSEPKSYVELPSGVAPGSWIFKKPYISADVTANEMHSMCTPCTTASCPKIPVCVKLTMGRSPDHTSNSVGFTHSKVAIGAYNYNSQNYITTLKYPNELGQGTEQIGYHYTYSLPLEMTCEGMKVYVNGTKGNDNIRLYQFDVYSGSCQNASGKREVNEVIEELVHENPKDEKKNKINRKLKVKDIDQGKNEIMQKILKPKFIHPKMNRQ